MMLPELEQQRQRLLFWANEGLAAVDPCERVRAALADVDQSAVAALAIGKAANGMARGASKALGASLETGLIISPQPPDPRLPDCWRHCTGDHPVPGEHSLAAGAKLAEWLRELPASLPLLVLLSGGGSALVELPVAGMGLVDLQRLNRWLLGSGLDIGRMNALRARFSNIKRGGLLRLAGTRPVTGLLISDVPGDNACDVASGPLCLQMAEWPATGLPEWLQSWQANLPLPEGQRSGKHADVRIIARNADVLDRVEQLAVNAGVKVATRGLLHGDAARAGREIATTLREGNPGLYLFGGETGVTLPPMPGRGGRNQHLALAAALELKQSSALLLALATDGVDGNTADAGALVDGGSLQRMRDAGVSAEQSLERADSGKALEASGDVVHTGPTGTNVADVVFAWKP